jgi:DNA ligase-1
MLQEAASHGVYADAVNPADPAAAGASTAAAAYAARGVGCVSKAQLNAAGAAVLAAYHRCPNVQIIADCLMIHGPDALEQRVQLSCGVPVKPMLARPCSGAADALKLLSGTAAAGAVAAARGRVKHASGAAAAAAGGQLGKEAAGVLSVSDEGEEGEGSEAEENDAGDSGEEEDGEAAALTVAAADAAAVVIGGKAQLGGGSGGSGSGVLSVLTEYKYDGQRAQIHVSADGQVR